MVAVGGGWTMMVAGDEGVSRAVKVVAKTRDMVVLTVVVLVIVAVRKRAVRMEIIDSSE